MNKRYYTTLVLLMSFSLIGIILMQGYWIYSSWQNKEEEFTLAVNRTLRQVVNEIQSRELNDYVYTYQMLIDSIGSPDESNFTDVFLFLDEDQSSNLSTFFAYGILEEDYNINLPNNLSNRYGIDDVKDYKAVKTTIVNKNILYKILIITQLNLRYFILLLLNIFNMSKSFVAFIVILSMIVVLGSLLYDYITSKND